MSEFRISKQTEAEKDQYLLECFHDAGFINELLKSTSSIISGRKGAGKTALARFLENKPLDYGLDYVCRLSVRNLDVSADTERHERVNSILFFILIQSIQKLLEKEQLSSESKKFWGDFLIQNNLQAVSDYETFIESKRTHTSGFSIKAKIAAWLMGSEGSVNGGESQESTRTVISNTPAALVSALIQSLPENKKFVFFIDDISDYLDSSDDDQLSDDVNAIKDVLLNLETYNMQFLEANKNMRFVSLIRNDLFDFMVGSNVNKLRTDALELEWNEKSFASLIIRRLPFFAENLEDHLRNPLEAIRSQFPDEVFSGIIEKFDTKHYALNFYSYMVAISFNRPRDFLKFCYAMRDRLSDKHPATAENIDSAEGEYSDYFNKELRDELFIASRMLKHELDQEELNRLIDLLSQENGFSSGQLRSEFAKYLGVRTGVGHKKIEAFILELWRYGVIGVREERPSLIHFKYMSGFVLTIDKIKHSVFCLHRGLWWFSRKRQSKKMVKDYSQTPPNTP